MTSEVERRIERLEKIADRLLDPERGIYAKLDEMESKQKSAMIAILSSILVELAVQFLT